MEGAYGLSKNSFMKFSEQQLVDCAGSEGNEGCNGGLMDRAFSYYEQNGIYETNHYGPYTARDGSCKAQKGQADIDGSFVTGYNMVDNNEAALVAAAAKQPVSIGIAASGSAFQFYTSGIITGPACGTQLDHGVLLVGYGTENNVDYYIVRNSWGANWGEKGYLRVERGHDTCGIDKSSHWNVYPTVA
jgi:cathepsin L